jgi:hypothetical protein
MEADDLIACYAKAAQAQGHRVRTPSRTHRWCYIAHEVSLERPLGDDHQQGQGPDAARGSHSEALRPRGQEDVR